MLDIDKIEGTKGITIGDIAKELQLSKTTISRAISGKGRIGEETRNRVLTYITEHDYTPNLIAKSLAQSKTFNIGVVLPADANLIETPFFQSCLMGICEVAASLDYDVVVTTVAEDDISLLKRIIRNHKVDGIILTRALVNDLSAEFLKSVRIPFVLIGSTEDNEIIQVDSNHIAACSELTSFLLMSGNNSLALIAGNQNHIVNQNRYKGYLDGFHKTKQQVNSNLVFLNMNNSTLIQQAVNKVVEHKADCIVCTDDLICNRTLLALGELGIMVPEQIKVASFYNSAFLENHNPPITALNMNVKVLGIKAGQQLIGLINKETIDSKIFVNYEIIIKESTK